MDPERWQTIKQILDDAAAAAPAQQQALIEQACNGDDALLLDVQTFLELDDDVDDFIEEPLWAFHREAEAEDEQVATASRRVGPYRIRRLLGRGGMGSVYLASREDDYEQQVALKLVTWGNDSDELLSRFYNERQILAHLQHPGIARLLDGGTFDDGMPYFVMEYVDGEPIDSYCESHRLAIDRRLDLFRQVCATVHFAHQNLIVHRDLKASNILVTEDGAPRLLDFGIAKLLEAEIGARKVATVAGFAPMTPAYASPEQLLNEPITTACDVYALGVLLYRLLTGHLPYKIDEDSFAEMVKAVCLREPQRPSTKIFGELAESGDDSAKAPSHREATKLHRRLRGDLDAIVLKAMRKEPEHRYGSVAELAEDIRRHQQGLPVLARKGSWLYHSGKFVRRNKPALAAILLIVAFAITTTILWRQAVSERAQAVRAQKRAEAATGFLENLFASADPDRTRGEDLTVREVLDQGRVSAVEELAEDVELHADMLGVLTTSYRRLGLLGDAVDLSKQTILLRRQSQDADPSTLARDLNSLASSLYSIGDYAQAADNFREALAIRRRLGQDGDEIDSILVNLAASLARQGEFDEAEKLYQEALDIRRELFGPRHSNTATSLYSLGSLHFTRGNFAAAEPLLRQALEIRAEHLGPEHTRVADVSDTLGLNLQLLGRLDDAKNFFERALAIRQRRLGEGHADVAETKRNLAGLLLDQGEIERGGRLAGEAFDALQASSPGNESAIAAVRRILGSYQMLQGNLIRAEVLLLESYEVLNRTRGENSFLSRDTRQRLADLYDAWGRPEQAAMYRTDRRASAEGTYDKGAESKKE
ncbi:MAG: serine/threonine-protein kinase [Acidobacteriota bacterium]